MDTSKSRVLCSALVAVGFSSVVSGAPYVEPGLQAKVDSRGSARVIVDVRPPSAGAEGAATALARITSSPNERVTLIEPNAAVMRVDSASLGKLMSSPQVLGVYVDRPSFPSLRETAEITAAISQWKAGREGGDVTIAVLDTGIDENHPFLKNKIVMQACFSVQDPARKITAVCPKGFLAGDSAVDLSAHAATGCAGKDPQCDHGTHVAGIAAGADIQDPDHSGLRLAGIARGASIFAIQVFSKIDDPYECLPQPAPCMGAYTSAQIRALEYVRSKVLLRQATETGPRIVAVNMSLGGGSHPAACDRQTPISRQIKALRDEDVVTFIAAGNDGAYNGIAMPACVSSAVAIGALDKPLAGGSLQYASYSNRFEDRLVSLLAIGTDVRSSIPGGSYKALMGTSMATPVAAGAYAILKAAFPKKGADELLAAMKATGTPVADPFSGKVLPALNVDLAYRRLAGLPLPQPISAVAATTSSPVLPSLTATRFIVELPPNKGSEGASTIQAISRALASKLNVEWVNASRLTSDAVTVSVPSPISPEALSAHLKEALGDHINLFVDRPSPPLRAPASAKPP